MYLGGLLSQLGDSIGQDGITDLNLKPAVGMLRCRHLCNFLDLPGAPVPPPPPGGSVRGACCWLSFTVGGAE